MSDDPRESERDPLDAFLADDLMPMPPLAPDGGFIPGPGLEMDPIPEVTRETMVCLRDCRHYIEITTRFAHGNTKGTLAKEPLQKNRYCRAIPGESIELTDELVRECSEWDPEPRRDQTRRQRQDTWLRQNDLVQLIRPNPKI
jgi:hypothetical protein